MATDTPRLQEAKGLLVDSHLRGLTPKYRHDLASKLLFSGTVSIPASWVTKNQRRFLDLRAHEDVDSGANACALQVMDQVKRLCGELVPALIADFLGTVVADRSERAYVRRCGRQVCEALFRTCRAWPNAEPRYLSHAARSAVHQALHTAWEDLRRAGGLPGSAGHPVQSVGTLTAGGGTHWPVNHADRVRRPDDRKVAADRRRRLGAVDGSMGNPDQGLGPVLRSDQAPTTNLDFDDKQTTRSTSSEAMARRYDWLEARRHRRNLQNATLSALAMLAAPVMFVVLVLGLRRFAPGLTVDQQTRIVATAFKATSGLTVVAGLGLAGRLFWTRLRRNHSAVDQGLAGNASTSPADTPAPDGRDDNPTPRRARRRR